jgi:predicted nucleic acid-binding protein
MNKVLVDTSVWVEYFKSNWNGQVTIDTFLSGHF